MSTIWLKKLWSFKNKLNREKDPEGHKEYRCSFGMKFLPSRLSVIFTNNVGVVANKLGHCCDNEQPELFVAYCIFDVPHRPCVVLHIDSPEVDLVHETGHITFNVLKYAGIAVTPDENEVFCYLQEFIYEKIRKFQKKIQAQSSP